MYPYPPSAMGGSWSRMHCIYPSNAAVACVCLYHRPLPLYYYNDLQRGWRPISQYQCSFHLKAALPLIKRLAADSDRVVLVSQCQCSFPLEAVLPSVERLAAASDCSSGTGPCDRRRLMTWHTCDWSISSRLIAHKHDAESELSRHDHCRYNYITQ